MKFYMLIVCSSLLIQSTNAIIQNKKICSLIVEGGAHTLQSFIDAGLWDEIRIETTPFTINNGIAAPHLPNNIDIVKKEFYGNTIVTYKRL